jgi:hypothetical protein
VTHDANCHTQLCPSTGFNSELININRKNKPRLPKSIPCHALSLSIPVSKLQLYVLLIEKSQLKSANRAGSRNVSFLTLIFYPGYPAFAQSGRGNHSLPLFGK